MLRSNFSTLGLDFSAMSISMLVLLSSVVAFLSVSFYRASTGRLRHIPGPFHTNLSQLSLKAATLTGQKIFYVDELHKRYGPVVRLAPEVVSVNDIGSLKQVYATVNGFAKDKWYLAMRPDNRRSGVFFAIDNKQHGRLRKPFSLAFSNSAMHTNWESTIRGHVAFTVDQMMSDIKSTGRADVAKWWTLMANDLGGLLFFGEDFKQVQMGKKSEATRMMEHVMLVIVVAAEFPIIRTIASWLPFESPFKIVDSYSDWASVAVANARNAKEGRNIFSGLLNTSNDSKHGIDELGVQIEASNMLLAATDTTSTALTYLVYAVYKHPESRKQLEEELKALPFDFTDAQLQELPWMNAVIQETLRLYGVASWLPREVPETGAIVNGFAIPGGITIGAQAYSFDHNPSIWEDPFVFKPTRFLRALTDNQKATFKPFGRGARTCLGKNQATIQLRYACAMFFRLGIDDPANKLVLAPSVTDASMKQVDHFILAPASKQCEVMLASA